MSQKSLEVYLGFVVGVALGITSYLIELVASPPRRLVVEIEPGRPAGPPTPAKASGRPIDQLRHDGQDGQRPAATGLQPEAGDADPPQPGIRPRRPALRSPSARPPGGPGTSPLLCLGFPAAAFIRVHLGQE